MRRWGGVVCVAKVSAVGVLVASTSPPGSARGALAAIAEWDPHPDPTDPTDLTDPMPFGERERDRLHIVTLGPEVRAWAWEERERVSGRMWRLSLSVCRRFSLNTIGGPARRAGVFLQVSRQPIERTFLFPHPP